MHKIVPDDDEAHGNVADHPGDEYKHVNDRDRHDNAQGQVFRTHHSGQVVGQRLVERARRVVHGLWSATPVKTLDRKRFDVHRLLYLKHDAI